MRKLSYSIESPAVPPRQRNWWVYLLLAVVCALNVLPYLWVVLTGFMDGASASAPTPQWLFTPSLEAFQFLIVDKGILKNFFNSVIVSFSSTFLSVTIGMFCAYALARYEFVGRDDVSFWVLTNRMMPPVAVLIPIFVIFQTVGLLDSLIGLIILYTAMQLPFVVWMLTGYFRDIPRRYEESAMVDGDTWFAAFRKVTLPVMMPSITATAIFVMILSWNEFAFATFLTSNNAKTMPPAVMAYSIGADIRWNVLGAAVVLITAPIILFVLLLQRQFISGLSQGVVRK
ncbi:MULTISPECIES: carbohydrate ABC transporter permease [unclassified Rhizobium]|uniref:carbohydrate ABC transporter permease n=1 Tax=unclassified Rhizobium TaxID=2613769 RepID=UPI00046F3F8A|nr:MULTISPECIES: carbohydrate ABC transporter permease [unclassified Rhizobium]NMN71535.1 multiple sugar transport system permease protein [Rhizobium sp. 57MFTsu3.2]